MQGHRRFAAFCDWVTRHEPASQRRLREATASQVHGRVLEVGVGTGANWEYLPEGIDYTGIEPDEYMLERARRYAHEQGRELRLDAHDVRDLPYDDASFDSALVTLVFCSVPEPVAGLREVFRVIRPGSDLLFLEHVRAGNGALAAGQSAVKPLTRRLLGGCEWDRNTADAIGAAGFELADLQRRGGLPPLIHGRARKPDA